MELGAADASGRRSPFVTGETFTLDVDMVIKAAGQMPFETMVDDHSMDHNNGKVLVTDKTTTNLTGIFAGGDCVNGGREVVDAVQAGKDGAAAIIRFVNT